MVKRRNLVETAGAKCTPRGLLKLDFDIIIEIFKNSCCVLNGRSVCRFLSNLISPRVIVTMPITLCVDFCRARKKAIPSDSNLMGMGPNELRELCSKCGVSGHGNAKALISRLTKERNRNYKRNEFSAHLQPDMSVVRRLEALFGGVRLQVFISGAGDENLLQFREEVGEIADFFHKHPKTQFCIDLSSLTIQSEAWPALSSFFTSIGDVFHALTLPALPQSDITFLRESLSNMPSLVNLRIDLDNRAEVHNIEALRLTPNLTALHLSSISSNVETHDALFSALAHLTSLERLCLHQVFGHFPVSRLAAALTARRIRHLELDTCDLRNADLPALAAAVPRLRHLTLASCRLGPAHAAGLAAALTTLTQLTSLDVSCNHGMGYSLLESARASRLPLLSKPEAAAVLALALTP